MKNKLYDLVFKLLTKYPELRDSDKKLMWSIWYIEGFVKNNALLRDAFYQASSCESIRRCRQKIQELHPDLRSSKRIKKEKQAIEKQRGTHIFREQVLFDLPRQPHYD